MAQRPDEVLNLHEYLRVSETAQDLRCHARRCGRVVWVDSARVGEVQRPTGRVEGWGRVDALRESERRVVSRDYGCEFGGLHIYGGGGIPRER